MYKLASLALTASLGVAGLSRSVPAEACGRVVIEGPRIAMGAPVVYDAGYYGPYYYEHGRYWRHDYDRYEHFHHHWDRR
jgi:hypothetical protein